MPESRLDRYLAENKLTHLAQETIDKFTEISEAVDAKLARNSSYSNGILATPNHDAFKNLAGISRTVQQEYQKLKNEPAVGRVVINFPDTGEVKVYYICRATPPTGVQNLISYRAPIGRLAALEIGETYDMGEETRLERYDEIDIVKIQQVTYIPFLANSGWDSRKTEYRDSKDISFKTILSLRKILEKEEEIDPAKIFEMYLQQQDKKSNVIDGIRKEIVEKFALPEQIFLDSQQDEIFRLPLNYSLLLLGPAGTGKTTTLIRRLGQKLDFDNGLTEEEKYLALKTFGTQDSFKFSWIMFTPTDLLKSYLKEAFNKENVPVSDERITTWISYRNKLGRDVLRILKTAKFESGFLHKEFVKTLQEDFDDPVELAGEFRKWLMETYMNELIMAMEQSVSLGLFKDTPFIDRFYDLVTRPSGSGSFCLAEIFDLIFVNYDKIDKAYKNERQEIENIIKNELGNQYRKNDKFFEEYMDFINSLDNGEQTENDDNEASETEIIDDDEDSGQSGNERIKNAINKYRNFITWLASRPDGFDAKKNISKNSRQLEWLGNRIPSKDVLKSINHSVGRLKGLGPLYNPLNKFFNSIAARYGRFRKLKQEENRFYNTDSALRKDINSTELDLLIYTKLEIAADLLRAQQISRNESSLTSSLRPVRENYKSQVFVDEAPDFSLLQLACLKLIAHPSINSFFACGDFNQRLVTEGTKGIEEIKSFLPGRLAERHISVPYRQTKTLYKFSLKVLDAIGGDSHESGHKENVHANAGLKPVLGEHLAGQQIASWVVDRIVEIEKILKGNIPSIAVLVPSEDDVKPIYKQIKENIDETTSALVQACSEGQTVGDGRAIRIFDIKHIKGLEFEAAFFVSLDRLAQTYPDLIGNYLYVGTTRAAQFLGVTCENKLPGIFSETLREDFTENWKI